MVKYLLKLDYVLSKWFAGKHKEDIVIPGTAFLFLNKVSFIVIIIVSAIIRVIGIYKRINLVVAIGVICTLIIMKGLQRSVERRVRKSKVEIAYKTMSKNQINQRRVLALLFLAISFYAMIVALILIFK